MWFFPPIVEPSTVFFIPIPETCCGAVVWVWKTAAFGSRPYRCCGHLTTELRPSLVLISPLYLSHSSLWSMPGARAVGAAGPVCWSLCLWVHRRDYPRVIVCAACAMWLPVCMCACAHAYQIGLALISQAAFAFELKSRCTTVAGVGAARAVCVIRFRSPASLHRQIDERSGKMSCEQSDFIDASYPAPPHPIPRQWQRLTSSNLSLHVHHLFMTPYNSAQCSRNVDESTFKFHFCFCMFYLTFFLRVNNTRVRKGKQIKYK